MIIKLMKSFLHFISLSLLPKEIEKISIFVNLLYSFRFHQIFFLSSSESLYMKRNDLITLELTDLPLELLPKIFTFLENTLEEFLDLDVFDLKIKRLPFYSNILTVNTVLNIIQNLSLPRG